MEKLNTMQDLYNKIVEHCKLIDESDCKPDWVLYVKDNSISKLWLKEIDTNDRRY